MALDEKDIELLERIAYKNSDDIAVSILRSFQRLEERIEVVESRLCSHITDVEDRIEGCRQDVVDELGDIKAEIRDLLRIEEEGAILK